MNLNTLTNLGFNEHPDKYTFTVLNKETGTEKEILKAIVDEENKRLVLIEGNVVTNNNPI